MWVSGGGGGEWCLCWSQDLLGRYKLHLVFRYVEAFFSSRVILHVPSLELEDNTTHSSSTRVSVNALLLNLK